MNFSSITLQEGIRVNPLKTYKTYRNPDIRTVDVSLKELEISFFFFKYSQLGGWDS